MSSLRIIILSENSEVETSSLSWNERLRIIRSCNNLWESAKTPEVEYLTLPGEDGELYVYPGYYDECRCSEMESGLSERMGEVDLGDHHFQHTWLPEDVTKKSILYTEDDGILRERMLVGDFHPLHDSLFVRFEVVA
jgi:hypothetical protein